MYQPSGQRLQNDEWGHADYLTADKAREAAKLGVAADCAEAEGRRAGDYQSACYSIGELHLK